MIESIAICDDSKTDAERTKNILTKFLKDVVNNKKWEINIYNNGRSLIDDIKNGIAEPTMVFMDVDMESQDLNGIDIVKIINGLSPTCHVVYLTNYLEYALDIFLTEHLYFVLKSELEKRLPEIYLKMINKNNEYQQVLRIEVKKNKFVAIKQSDIIYLERNGRRTLICGKEENWETYLSLNQLEEMIQDKGIIRCHNSYMVAMKEINSYVRELCIMSNGHEIPISRKYQPIFKQKFLQWSKGQIF